MGAIAWLPALLGLLFGARYPRFLSLRFCDNYTFCMPLIIYDYAHLRLTFYFTFDSRSVLDLTTALYTFVLDIRRIQFSRPSTHLERQRYTLLSSCRQT